jgi:hypothetical protein
MIIVVGHFIKIIVWTIRSINIMAKIQDGIYDLDIDIITTIGIITLKKSIVKSKLK